MKVRMVVTGRRADGRSVFVSDQQVEPLTVRLVPGAEFHRLWGSDDPPTLPLDGSPPAPPAYFPPVGGYRFVFFTLPPQAPGDAAGDIDLDEALQEFETNLPGMAAHMEPDNPGMHTTDTVDLGVVVSGEIVLELDEGAEVKLGPGDTYVQNGTRHRWQNRGSEPAVLAVAIIGARPD